MSIYNIQLHYSIQTKQWFILFDNSQNDFYYDDFETALTSFGILGKEISYNFQAMVYMQIYDKQKNLIKESCIYPPFNLSKNTHFLKKKWFKI